MHGLEIKTQPGQDSRDRASCLQKGAVKGPIRPREGKDTEEQAGRKQTERLLKLAEQLSIRCD